MRPGGEPPLDRRRRMWQIKKYAKSYTIRHGFETLYGSVPMSPKANQRSRGRTSPGRIPSIKNKTKREVVYKSLKKQINSGYIMPGTRLIELELASQYAVSRTIIREVIKHLAAEGLVHLTPYKGATVAKTSITDLEEIYRIQQDLEGLAAYLATNRLTSEHIREMERIHEASMAHTQGDVSGWQKWNTRFHRILIENCGNSRLVKVVESQRDQFARYWFLLLSIPGCMASNTKEHEKIIAAVKARKPDQVRFLMERHFEGAAKRLLDIIKNVYPSSFIV